MDINNVSTFITLDPSKLFNAERFYNRAMVMYEGDEDLVESFLKEHLASDSLAYAMHLLEETSSTSYMGVKIHYNGTSFSAPTAGVYGVKSRPEIKARIKAKVLKRNDQQNKAAAVKKEDFVDAAIEVATDYFYEEGINEDGIDILIEEIGLDDFVDFVDGGGAIDLNEERAARKASVKAKKYDVVKKEVDKADAARKASKKGEYAPSYAKKETDVTVYDDKPAAKKKATSKPAPKKVVKPVAKKVERVVTKVKKSQPKKEVSKKGIRGAIERGVARHKKAVGDAKAAYSKQRAKGKVPEKRAKEFASGVKSGVKTAVKFAKDVK